MKIDRGKFFDGYRKTFGPLKQSQVDGLETLLGMIERDPYITDKRQVAYTLATVHHECAGTWRPIRERGSHDYFVRRYGGGTRVGRQLGNDTPEEGAIYQGRGYTQVTGKTNYERQEAVIRKEYPEVVAEFERRTGRTFDLTVGDQAGDASDPDNMLDAAIAYCSMSVSMRKGLYTGVGLSRYIEGERCDYVNARKIINGLDCAEKIAGCARAFEAMLSA